MQCQHTFHGHTCTSCKFCHLKKYHTELNGLFFAKHISKIVKTEKNLCYNLFMNSFTLLKFVFYTLIKP